MGKRKEKADQNAVAELTREGLYKENKWLWEENKKLREKLSEITMVADDEKQSIEHILELEEENRKLKDSNTILKKGGQVVFTLEKRIDELLEENKKLRDLKCVPSNLKTLIRIDKENERLEEENKKLKETIKDHQLYEEKLEHRIIELEELLHGE